MSNPPIRFDLSVSPSPDRDGGRVLRDGSLVQVDAILDSLAAEGLQSDFAAPFEPESWFPSLESRDLL